MNNAVRVAMEPLEQRVLLSLSILPVTSLTDTDTSSDTPGTLRYAIKWAVGEADTGQNEVVSFASGLTGTITLGGSALAINNTSGKVTMSYNRKSWMVGG
ncbi:MAG: LEPR-XLL domain-containing protein [Tepidisphaeraceae bacterium]|jgi:hypothetical protein